MKLQNEFGFMDEIAKDNLLLRDKFIEPPFSVLDTKQGSWQDRKRAWLALGIQSELGRGEGLTWGESEEINHPTLNSHREKNKGLARTFGQDLMKGENPNFRQDADKRSNITGAPLKPEWATGTGETNMAPGTSIFDPVLCELIYRWFCIPNGKILDPFAGGSVRGIVANYLGYHYTGIDLSERQLGANREQAESLVPDNKPIWITGDSRDIKTLVDDNYDLVFSCPPYYNLEVYGEDERDLSLASTFKDFTDGYIQIIQDSVSLLKPNRFACFVVGNIRDKTGYYHNLVGATIHGFKSAGAKFYNDAVLLTAIGSLPIRITEQFESGRKMGKTHQNVLIFYKGDTKRIKEIFNT